MFFFHSFVCDGLINQERQSALLAFSAVKKPWRPCDCQDVATWDSCSSSVNHNLAKKMRKVLAVLTPREEKILRMRFGIGEKRDHTLDEISRKFDLTRERIRQIEARALEKLQRSKHSRSLRSFIDS
jgi:RNA polymerase primary sigma factor